MIVSFSGEAPSKVYIIDFSWLMYRYYYAYPRVRVFRKDIEIPTGHLYGVANVVCSLLASDSTTSVILALDSNPKTLKEKFPFYKAHRKDKSETKKIVFGNRDSFIEVLTSLPGVYYSIKEDTEADTLIASMADKFKLPMFLIANDMDIQQKVREGVTVLANLNFTKTGVEFTETLDTQGVIDKHQVHPTRIPMLKCIVGDSSDNIKRIVPRFPTKLALRIANKYPDPATMFDPNTQFSLGGTITPTERKWLLKLWQEKEKMFDYWEIVKIKNVDFTLSKQSPTKEVVQKWIEYYDMQGLRIFMERRNL